MTSVWLHAILHAYISIGVGVIVQILIAELNSHILFKRVKLLGCVQPPLLTSGPQLDRSSVPCMRTEVLVII